MLDTVIRGGTLIDGSGAERREADVGIRDGRIEAVGEISEAARAEIDAGGHIVAPGFVDIHTHYDAQAFWDSMLSPSPFHGVTTVVGGNCGFSIAPLAPGAGEYLMKMLSRVEGMPLESLREGVPWDWTSFSEYLDRLEGKLAVNAGFMVGHSALRRSVMGEAASGGAASTEDVAAMQALLAESLAGGGLGFSSSWARTHNDGAGKPVPSRAADRDEILALCRTTGEFPGTSLEFIPTIGPFAEEHCEIMAEMSLAAGRALNWNVLVAQTMGREIWEGQLAASDYATERGARVLALTPPLVMEVRLNFVSGFVLDAFPGWADLFGLPLDERKKRLADPSERERLDASANSEEAGVFRALAQWENISIAETFSESTKRFEGRRIGEIAEETGKKPFDAMLDIVLEDDLRTSLQPASYGHDDESWKIREEIWRDPRSVIGASDAGAHLDMINTFVYTTALLEAVRERGLLSLEEAVHQLTQVPAELYGLHERGRLAEGFCADVTIFDADRVAPTPLYTRHDLPAGASRLYADAIGVENVLVNGCEIVRGGEATGASPGTILRSGRDTETVGIPGRAST
ncbi:MAG: amidohydrolase family protein [Myxococcota bacterium]|jgi:N-acyl-D-aspartate/D-glutamate deacylase